MVATVATALGPHALAGRPGKAALKVDEKHYVVSHQPAQGQHLRGEKVGPGRGGKGPTGSKYLPSRVRI
ncbi:MAG TPA: hypothetical protein VGG61_03460, partial [Gemmataceae bacterium]